ncbi:nodulation protein NfeD [Paenibacillus sp. YPG26]|uniref:NfeD family protein n=1 Tax=Paenibacillus sp. YPG26 TaxID=2878915 RepID=UPI002040668C|nr:nodulation protein NfeD [Paenibacillus sp. YPG26]USB35013.1 nodulation protein NfeD [Paenibacillus sp. YPG26]
MFPAVLLVLLLVSGFAPALLSSVEAASAPAKMKSGTVYVIPLDQKIESGLEKFLVRGFKEAKDQGAALIVLEVNTPGGRVDNAENIGQLIAGSPIPTVAFIQGNAASAGSYIALHADKIAMRPDSAIGAAALVDASGQTVDSPKEIAYWKSKMSAAADLQRRNPRIAEGMVDSSITVEMPEINRTKEKGQIISLSSSEALKVGYADTLADTTEEVIQWMGYSGEDTFRVERTLAENVAIFLTNPFVMTALLFLGIAGVVIELLVPGFGVPGILGVVAFGLYFFGNYIAGFAGLETGVLFVIGLVLLALELFIPSFGILGILGSACLIAGVVRAAYDTQDALTSLGIAFLAALVVIVIVVWIFKERGIWNRFILRDELTSDKGYSSIRERIDLLGLEGTSLTPLRPAGTAVIGGERIDVVTEGGFIKADMPLKVIKVEGTRVVVAEI